MKVYQTQFELDGEIYCSQITATDIEDAQNIAKRRNIQEKVSVTLQLGSNSKGYIYNVEDLMKDGITDMLHILYSECWIAIKSGLMTTEQALAPGGLLEDYVEYIVETITHQVGLELGTIIPNDKDTEYMKNRHISVLSSIEALLMMNGTWHPSLEESVLEGLKTPNRGIDESIAVNINDTINVGDTN